MISSPFSTKKIHWFWYCFGKRLVLRRLHLIEFPYLLNPEKNNHTLKILTVLKLLFYIFFWKVEKKLKWGRKSRFHEIDVRQRRINSLFHSLTAQWTRYRINPRLGKKALTLGRRQVKNCIIKMLKMTGR